MVENFHFHARLLKGLLLQSRAPNLFSRPQFPLQRNADPASAPVSRCFMLALSDSAPSSLRSAILANPDSIKCYFGDELSAISL